MNIYIYIHIKLRIPKQVHAVVAHGDRRGRVPQTLLAPGLLRMGLSLIRVSFQPCRVPSHASPQSNQENAWSTTPPTPPCPCVSVLTVSPRLKPTAID